MEGTGSASDGLRRRRERDNEGAVSVALTNGHTRTHKGAHTKRQQGRDQRQTRIMGRRLRGKREEEEEKRREEEAGHIHTQSQTDKFTRTHTHTHAHTHTQNKLQRRRSQREKESEGNGQKRETAREKKRSKKSAANCSLLSLSYSKVHCSANRRRLSTHSLAW